MNAAIGNFGQEFKKMINFSKQSLDIAVLHKNTINSIFIFASLQSTECIITLNCFLLVVVTNFIVN